MVVWVKSLNDERSGDGRGHLAPVAWGPSPKSARGARRRDGQQSAAVAASPLGDKLRLRLVRAAEELRKFDCTMSGNGTANGRSSSDNELNECIKLNTTTASR